MDRINMRYGGLFLNPQTGVGNLKEVLGTLKDPPAPEDCPIPYSLEYDYYHVWDKATRKHEGITPKLKDAIDFLPSKVYEKIEVPECPELADGWYLVMLGPNEVPVLKQKSGCYAYSRKRQPTPWHECKVVAALGDVQFLDGEEDETTRTTV